MPTPQTNQLSAPAPAVVPVAVSERPWEKGGWTDLDGECWWCPPDGPAYWSMANPAMVYGGWLLPAHALPVPQAGEAPRKTGPAALDDNPAPDSRSPLEVVVSQQTAMRALVRHYGWVHNGPNILYRPGWSGGREVTSPASTTAEPPLIELIETPGEIADLGAAAAAAVA
jgi:hypothetical protein